MYSYLTIFVASSMGGQLAPAPPLSPQQIAQANLAAVQSIRSLIVHNTSYLIEPDSTKTKRSEYTWYWSGENQRLKQRLPYKKNAAQSQLDLRKNKDFLDWDKYNGPQGFKEAYNCDADDPPPLSENDGGQSYGAYGPRTTNNSTIGPSPKSQLLLEVLEVPDVVPLIDLVRTSKSARVAKIPAESSLRCYELVVRRKSTEFTVYVEPTANFMIRRVDILPMGLSSETQGKARVLLEADGFRDYGNGVFLPTAVRSEMSDLVDKAKKVRKFIDVDVKSVNEPLPPGSFDIRFVPWLRVTDQATGQLHLWGPNDKPLRTFNSADEYGKWYDTVKANRVASGGQEGRQWRAALAIIVLLAVLATSILWQRRYRSKRRVT